MTYPQPPPPYVPGGRPHSSVARTNRRNLVILAAVGGVGFVVAVILIAVMAPSQPQLSTTGEAAVTTTEAAPATTAAAPAAAAPADPYAKFATDLGKALSASNRNAARVAVTHSGANVEVKVAFNDNLTGGLVRDGAKHDVGTIIKTVQKDKLDVELLHVTGTFLMQDAYGATSEATVVDVSYSRATIGRIQPDTIRDVYAVADQVAFIHNQFR